MNVTGVKFQLAWIPKNIQYGYHTHTHTHIGRQYTHYCACTAQQYEFVFAVCAGELKRNAVTGRNVKLK